VAVVYASEHLAMAATEKFVHLPKPLPALPRLFKFRLVFGKASVMRISIPDLPRDWRSEPAPRSTQRLGDAWVLSGESAIVAVPSVLYPEETNYLLNPAHPDFAKIEIFPAEPFSFDPRLARLRDQ
jgi:RES domain-containing protein